MFTRRHAALLLLSAGILAGCAAEPTTKHYTETGFKKTSIEASGTDFIREAMDHGYQVERGLDSRICGKLDRIFLDDDISTIELLALLATITDEVFPGERDQYHGGSGTILALAVVTSCVEYAIPLNNKVTELQGGN